MRGCDDVCRNVIAGRRRYTEAERQRGPQRGDLAAVFKTENRLLCIDTMRMFAMIIHGSDSIPLFSNFRTDLLFDISLPVLSQFPHESTATSSRRALRAARLQSVPAFGNSGAAREPPVVKIALSVKDVKHLHCALQFI